MLFDKWVPEVQADRCNACRICLATCRRGCLDLVDGTAFLVNPEACTSEAQCVSVCSDRAIRMTWAQVDGNSRVGRWRPRRLAGLEARAT